MKYFATLPFITNEVSNKATLAVATPHGAQAIHVRPYEQLASSTNWNPTLFFYFPWQERRTQNCPPCFAHCFWLILPLSRSLI